jgi:hypothetical protein
MYEGSESVTRDAQMKRSSQKPSRDMQSSTKQNSRRSSRKQSSRMQRTTSMAPAVLVGTTQEARPKLVVKRPRTLAEAIAEPVIDVAKEKPVSIRKVAR